MANVLRQLGLAAQRGLNQAAGRKVTANPATWWDAATVAGGAKPGASSLLRAGRYAYRGGQLATLADTGVETVKGVKSFNENAPAELRPALTSGLVRGVLPGASNTDRTIARPVVGSMASHFQDPTQTGLGQLSRGLSYLNPATFAYHQARGLVGKAIDPGIQANTKTDANIWGMAKSLSAAKSPMHLAVTQVLERDPRFRQTALYRDTVAGLRR